MTTNTARRVLLGGYVDDSGSALDGAPSYLAFIAPGLLAATGMRVTLSEVTATSVKVNWTGVASATGYQVSRTGKDARFPAAAEGWSTRDPSSARARVFDHLGEAA